MSVFTPKKTSSAIDKLQLLPECFNDKTFLRMTGLSSAASRVALSRLKKTGLIESAGDRSGIYFNLLKDAQAKNKYAVDALLSVYPSAILSNESVLHNAGWITQIPSLINVSVLARKSYQKIDGFEIHGEPLSWYRKFNPYFLPGNYEEFSTFGMRSLPPALACAQIMANGGCGLNIDDIDIPDEEASKIKFFCEQFNSM
jgi:hypothetical protein